jgi:hypothetical protein
MWQQAILELLDVLAPALKSRKKAFRLMQEHWSNKTVIIWTTEDLHRAANGAEDGANRKGSSNSPAATRGQSQSAVWPPVEGSLRGHRTEWQRPEHHPA